MKHDKTLGCDAAVRTRELLTEHYSRYPEMEISDIFKYLFQSAFGCEHLVSDRAAVTEYIKRELESMSTDYPPCIDKLDGAYSRVHLSCLDGNLTPEEFAELFCLSAKTEVEGRVALIEKIRVAREMILDGDLPFSVDEFDTIHSKWSELGYPAIHHSPTFREAYRPAYRVIADEFLDKIKK